MAQIAILLMSANYMLPSKPVVESHRQCEEKIMTIITTTFIKDNKAPKAMPLLPQPFGKTGVALRSLLVLMTASGDFGTQPPSQKNSNTI